MEEKRRFPRWTIAGKAFYKREGEKEAREGWSNNISCWGVSLSLPEEVKPNSELNLNIHLSDNLSPIITKGKVMWVSPVASGSGQPFFAGVRFDGLRHYDRDKIFSYAYQFRREEILKHWWQGVS